MGAAGLPVYALALAHTGDVLEAHEMVGASALLVTLSSVGSVLGPVVVTVGFMMAGSAGLFVVLVAVYGALAAFSAWRLTRRPGVHPTSSFVAVSPRGTAVTATLVADALGGEDGAERAVPA